MASSKEIEQPGLGYDWTGLSREQSKSGGQAIVLFGLGILVVFLILAAQYENYIDPIIILLTVPFAVLGAMVFISFRGLVNDLYCQVALVMLIGLASKMLFIPCNYSWDAELWKIIRIFT